MKKIFIFILLLSILVVHFLQEKSSFSFSDYFSFGDITVYSQSDNSSFLPNIEMNGKGKVVGESIRFNKVEPLSLINTLNAEIKFFEYIENQDLTIIYCYSNLIDKEVTVKNENINLQIAYCEDYTIIGWPLILGSF